VPAWFLLGFLLLQGSSDAVKEEAERLHNDGLTLFEQGRVDEGREALLRSLALHEQIREKPAQAVNLRVLAFIHDGIGERQQALGYYDRALRLMRETANRAGEALTLRDIGVLYYNLDENARAFQYMEQALGLQRTLGKPAALATTLFSLGELYRYRGNAGKARPYFEEALGLARGQGDKKTQAEVLSSLAMLDLKAGELAGAGARLEEALALRKEVGEPRGVASTLTRRGLYLQAAGETARAREAFREAAGMFAAVKYRGGEAYARQVLALLEREQGDLAAAEEAMARAVELAEGLRERLSDRDLRSTYIGYVQNRYEFLIEVLLELDKGDGRRAFAMSERARARAMVEALGDAGIQGAAAAATLTVEEVQQRVLDADTTLVEYALGEKASHLFVVTRAGVTHRTLPGRAVLEATARRAYEAYRQPEGKPDGAALARLLLPGVRAKRLLIVADGALQYLPFVAFAPAETVVLAPSASAVAGLRALPVAGGKGIAVFADPVAPQLARLAFARMEGDGIVGLAPKGQASLAVGAAATRAAVLGARAGILHFAAHSLLDTERPERTELVLSGGSLRLRDIYNMRVPARLVVLSACQTALGKEMKREGLLGLARAFQQAGVPRVVASLWKVDDRATAELMKEFYAGMLRDGRTAAEALREAQRRLAAKARWQHPYFWAGFVLQGEWR
jgi:CHAT domain-containing protein/Tfp pilus assembly protein PilF